MARRRCAAVFVMQDPDTQRVYRPHDFTKSHLIRPRHAYCVAGKVNSADRLYLVIESVRPDAKQAPSSTVRAPADGAVAGAGLCANDAVGSLTDDKIGQNTVILSRR